MVDALVPAGKIKRHAAMVALLRKIRRSSPLTPPWPLRWTQARWSERCSSRWGAEAPVALADERVGAWQAAHRSCHTPCHRSFLIIDPGEDRKDLAEVAEESDEEIMEEN